MYLLITRSYFISNFSLFLFYYSATVVNGSHMNSLASTTILCVNLNKLILHIFILFISLYYFPVQLWVISVSVFLWDWTYLFQFHCLYKPCIHDSSLPRLLNPIFSNKSPSFFVIMKISFIWKIINFLSRCEGEGCFCYTGVVPHCVQKKLIICNKRVKGAYLREMTE